MLGGREEAGKRACVYVVVTIRVQEREQTLFLRARRVRSSSSSRSVSSTSSSAVRHVGQDGLTVTVGLLGGCVITLLAVYTHTRASQIKICVNSSYD